MADAENRTMPPGATIVALSQEVERLREALSEIARLPQAPVTWEAGYENGYNEARDTAAAIARTALEWPHGDDPKTTRPDWLAKGKTLRDLRVARGEAQRAAAERMGISPRLLNDVEHGRADPLALLFPEIADGR